MYSCVYVCVFIPNIESFSLKWHLKSFTLTAVLVRSFESECYFHPAFRPCLSQPLLSASALVIICYYCLFFSNYTIFFLFSCVIILIYYFLSHSAIWKSFLFKFSIISVQSSCYNLLHYYLASFYYFLRIY